MRESLTPVWQQVLAILLFAVFAIVSIAYFLNVVIELTSGIIGNKTAIVFEKGGFYFLGISIVSGALAYIYGVETYQQNMPSDSLTGKIKTIVFLGLAIMLLLPHIISTVIGSYLESHSYVECEALTRKWVHSHTLVYTKGMDLCNHLIIERNLKRKKPG